MESTMKMIANLLRFCSMRASTTGLVAALAIALVLPAPVAAQTITAKPTNAYSASVATEWFQLALQLVQQTPGFSPPIAARALGYKV